MSDEIDRLAINTIRTLSMDAVQKAKSGHPGTPMALAPVIYTLWQRHLRYDPQNPLWPNRDRFVLSAGHASMLLYATLFLAGVREMDRAGRRTGAPAVSLDDIKAFRQIGSKCPGHPEYGRTTGVEATTGPLGQGIGMSVGMAIAARWKAAHFNRPHLPLFDYRIFAICSDGDMMEGIGSEAASLAGHLRLGNLCWIYDQNHITIEGSTDLAFDEDVGARFSAYGWSVLHAADANDTADIDEKLAAAAAMKDCPTLVIVRSHIGYGAPNKQDTKEAHGEPLGEDEVRAAKRAYGWPDDKVFLVPGGVEERFEAGIGKRGGALHAAWQELVARYRQSEPESFRAFERMNNGGLPPEWNESIEYFAPDAKGLATRDSGGKVLNEIAAHLPWMIGGAADLSPSTKTDIKGEQDFEASIAGRNLHFGIREHAMGAVINGITLSGLRGYGATFLIFSDYMRPAIRLSALMEIPSIWIFTHDSIGLGEDGPTHQPIEQLMGLRTMPGMIVLRPCDANEVVEAWQIVAQMRRGPTCLILSRQKLPTFDRHALGSAKGVARGAYVLADTEEGTPQVILIATGSEVAIALQAYESLSQAGIRVRLVSMPSWELFDSQDQAYRDKVLPPAIEARISIEAGSTIGWERYVGRNGARIGMESFGASAPAGDVYRKFGITAEAIEQTAHALLEGVHRAPPNPLKKLDRLGQSVWLDYISRSLIHGGELEKLIKADGISGVTSNPSIFQKAISHGNAYDADIGILADNGEDTASIIRRLSIEDIQDAADILKPIYDASGGGDGFVSIEVSPELAYDAKASLAEARSLWKKVARENLMVKIPGTRQGIPAIRTALAEGININITLLFSRKMYEEVAEAWLSALEERVRLHDIACVSSVASFFVSRIDTRVDAAIEDKIRTTRSDGRAQLESLRGKVAVANAKLAYQHYKCLIAGERWKRLAIREAKPQRLLWASTSTKNKAYRDVVYVESLIGADTINTMPPETMDAFRDHGMVEPTVETAVDEARNILARLDGTGISLDKITDDLIVDGVEQFAAAADKLFSAVEEKRSGLHAA